MSRCVFVIIPVHNRISYTLACLRTLRDQSFSNVTVLVVDDGSSDGTAEAIAKEFPSVRVLKGDGQLWWAGATQLGVDWVLKRCEEDDWILTLNNDTTVNPNYVETLVGVFENLRRHILVGSVAVDSRDGNTIHDGGPHVNWLTAQFGSENAGGSLSELLSRGMCVTYPDLLPGRGTLIPVKCFMEVGGYDAKRLPHYAADYEFSVRAARAGYQLIMSYEAHVRSEVEATGISTVRGRLSWKDFSCMFFSRRSPTCLKQRWQYGRLAAPRHLVSVFIVADTVRVLGGAFRDQLRGARR